MTDLCFDIGMADLIPRNWLFRTTDTTPSQDSPRETIFSELPKPFQALFASSPELVFWDNNLHVRSQRLWILLGWGLVLACVFYLSIDFAEFVNFGYRNYQKAARWDFDEPSMREAIVVLTGDRTRIPKAFELLRRRHCDWLIISGAGRGITLTELVNQQGDSATSIHMVWERIVLESRSSSTIENARESNAIIREKKPERVFLVTSDYHMLRAATIFRDVIGDREIIEYPISSGLIGEWILNENFIRFFWIIGLEYWKYRLYITRRDIDPQFPLAG